MKTNPNDPISAVDSDLITDIDRGRFNNLGSINPLGLTKREYFAGLAMQALTSDPNRSMFSWESAAQESVGIADALVNELNK